MTVRTSSPCISTLPPTLTHPRPPLAEWDAVEQVAVAAVEAADVNLAQVRPLLRRDSSKCNPG